MSKPYLNGEDDAVSEEDCRMCRPRLGVCRHPDPGCGGPRISWRNRRVDASELPEGLVCRTRESICLILCGRMRKQVATRMPFNLGGSREDTESRADVHPMLRRALRHYANLRDGTGSVVGRTRDEGRAKKDGEGTPSVPRIPTFPLKYKSN